MIPVYEDAHGKTLQDYPRPSVAVDTAVLTLDVDREQLLVLQVRRPDGSGWALPGTIVRERERLAAAVQRSLAVKADVHDLEPRQLHVFDEPDRDPRGWVMSVAHLAVVTPDPLATRFPDRTRLMPVGNPGRLPYRHGEIIDRAVEDLRARYSSLPDPDELLGRTFTMRELLLAHSAVAGEPLQRDTFRRAMRDLVVPANQEPVQRGRGRPAELFRRA
jgi:8-oxo-dGTP diphosphatase